MKSVIFSYIFILIVLGSCKSKEKRKNILPGDNILIPLLADMHFAEAAAEVYIIDKRDSMFNIFKHQVFEIHRTDSVTYNLYIDYLQLDFQKFADKEKLVNIFIKKVEEDKKAEKKVKEAK
ncbi:MAG: hypothetical protein V3V14_06285 [Saprospiraceae bacterium]